MKAFAPLRKAALCLRMCHVLSSWTAQTTRQYHWEISAMFVSLDETRRNKCSSFSELVYSYDFDAWSLNVTDG
jgi:hypothetical protein